MKLTKRSIYKAGSPVEVVEFLGLPDCLRLVSAVGEEDFDAEDLLLAVQKQLLPAFVDASALTGALLDPASNLILRGAGFQRLMKPERVQLTPDGAAMTIDFPLVEGDAWAYIDDQDTKPDLHRQGRWHVSTSGCEVYLKASQLAARLSADGAEPPAPHRPKMRDQEQAILSALRDLGLTPSHLPRTRPGKPGTKSQVWSHLQSDSALFSRRSFDKAWERLRCDGLIAEGESSPKEG